MQQRRYRLSKYLEDDCIYGFWLILLHLQTRHIKVVSYFYMYGNCLINVQQTKKVILGPNWYKNKDRLKPDTFTLLCFQSSLLIF